MTNSGRLAGKVAIVTGGGRGIGRAEALALAAEGASVVVNDPGFGLSSDTVDESVAEEVVRTIRAEGGRAVANFGDCADWSAAEEIVATAVREFGRLDILVNNAGNLRERMSFNMTEDDFDSVVRVHVKGHFAMCRHAGAYWRSESKAGRTVEARIINTSSDSGLFGQGAIIGYSVSKAGIVAMTVALARELAAYGVRVNAVVPGSFRTRMQAFREGHDDIDEASPELGRSDATHPSGIGPTVVWLASDAVDFTGQVVWSSGTSVELYQGWRPVARVSSQEVMSPSELIARSDELFAGWPKAPVDPPPQDSGHWTSFPFRDADGAISLTP